MLTSEQIIQKYGTQTTPSASGNSSGNYGSPGSMNSDQILQKYGGQGTSAPATPFNAKDSAFHEALNMAGSIADSAANKVNSVYEGYKNLPGVKQFGQLVGGVVGGAQALTSAGVEALGTPLIQGARVFSGKAPETFGQTMSRIGSHASEGFDFGYGIGKEGAAAAPIGATGKIITIPLAFASGWQGQKDVREGYAKGDAAQMFQGGLELGTAALAARTAFKTKGLGLLNEPAKNALIERFPGSEKILKPIETYHNSEAYRAKQIAKANKITSDVLNQNSGEKKAAQRMELKGQGKNVAELINKEGLDKGIERVDGKLETTKAREQVQASIEAADNLLSEKLAADPTPKHSSTVLSKRVMDSIDSLDGKTASAKNAMRADFESVMADEALAKGVKPGTEFMMNDAELQSLKRGLYDMSGDYTKSPGTKAIFRSAAHEARVMIEDAHPTGEIYAINSRMSDLLAIDKALEAAQGRVVRGNFLGKKFNQVIGGMVGSHFGPLGTLAGVEAAGKLTDIQLDPASRLTKATGLMRKYGPQNTQK